MHGWVMWLKVCLWGCTSMCVCPCELRKLKKIVENLTICIWWKLRVSFSKKVDLLVRLEQGNIVLPQHKRCTCTSCWERECSSYISPFSIANNLRENRVVEINISIQMDQSWSQQWQCIYMLYAKMFIFAIKTNKLY